MAWLAPFLVGRIPVAALANPPALVELFAETITEELDFRLEAENMLDVARSFAELGQRGYVVPRPHPTLVTRRVLVMERLDGFAFDDVAGMQRRRRRHRGGRAHRDDRLHGGRACSTASSTATCTAGTCSCCPTGAPRCSTSASPAASTSPAGWRSSACSSAPRTNDVTGQLEAPPRPRRAAARHRPRRRSSATSGSTGPPIDPTTLAGDELVAEIQRIVKALLGYGARLPKELMLFVKNMVFLDGAIATLAPDLDLFAEIAHISMYFADDPRRAHRRGARHRPRRRTSSTSTGVKAQLRRRPESIEHSPTASCRSGASSSASRFQNREVG